MHVTPAVVAVVGDAGFAMLIAWAWLARRLGVSFIPGLLELALFVAISDLAVYLLQGQYIAGVIQAVEAVIILILLIDDRSERKRRKSREKEFRADAERIKALLDTRITPEYLARRYEALMARLRERRRPS